MSDEAVISLRGLEQALASIRKLHAEAGRVLPDDIRLAVGIDRVELRCGSGRHVAGISLKRWDEAALQPVATEGVKPVQL